MLNLKFSVSVSARIVVRLGRSHTHTHTICLFKQLCMNDELEILVISSFGSNIECIAV